MTVLLAFDLETVPDTSAGRRLFGLSGTDAEVAAAMLARRMAETDGRTDFLKPAYHRVVGIGAVAVALTAAPQLKLQAWAGDGEHVLIALFLEALRKHPQVVSWNGSGFDLPVLRYRAMMHGLAADTLYGPADQRQWDSYAYRYGKAHIDLMDVLAGYGASPAMKLDEMARLAGLPGKTVASGEQVGAIAFAGDWNRIERYVADDALQTLLLFLRWQAGCGHLSTSTYISVLKALRPSIVDDTAMVDAVQGWIVEADEKALVRSA